MGPIATSRGKIGVLSLWLFLELVAMAGSPSISIDLASGSRDFPEAHNTKQTTVQTEVQDLVPGVPIERELAGGDVHAYAVTLAAGQYLRLMVDQRGIDVVVTVFGPDGQPVGTTSQIPRGHGPEPISVMAEASGTYRLELRAAEDWMLPGQYEVKIEEWRQATEQDIQHIAAERAVAQALQTQLGQATAEARLQALKQSEEALAIFRASGDTVGEAAALWAMGRLYRWQGHAQEGLTSLNQALSLFRSVRDPGREAQTLRDIGRTHFLLRQLEQGRQVFEQALELFRASGDRYGEASACLDLGYHYAWFGRSEEALPHYRRALTLHRALRDRSSEALALNHIGVAYDWLGDKQQAIEFHQQALPVFQELGDRQMEGSALIELGWNYWLLGEHQKALDLYRQALPLFQSLGDLKNQAHALKDIGLVYESLGEPEKALEYHRQALELCRAAEYKLGEARTLTHIGSAYRRLDQPEKALETFQQALAVSRAINMHREEGVALNHIGTAYQSLGEPKKALEYYHQALAVWRAVTNQNEEISTLANIGSVYHSLGKWEKALQYYDQALQLSQRVGDRAREAEALYGIARVERQRTDLSQARARIEAALNITESLRATVASQELRTSYLASKRDYYEFYIDLLMRLHQRDPSAGHEGAALHVSERARARSLLETLTEARADIRQGVTPALLEHERTIQQQLSAKADRLARLLSVEDSEEQVAVTKKELEALLIHYQEVQGQIRATSPRYAALTQPEPLSLRDIQQQVLDEETLLLEYALGQERSYLWAVTPTSLSSFELPSRGEIESAARRVYNLLVAQPSAQYPKEVIAFSRMLLGPVAAQLGKKRLLIVADGALQYVLFGALPKPVVRGQGLGIRGQ